MSEFLTVDGEKISVSSYTTSDGVCGLILNISEGGSHRAASFLRPDESTALATALLEGAAIVTDPQSMLTLIMEYALVFGDQDIDNDILALIKTALGLPVDAAKRGIFVTDPAGLWALIQDYGWRADTNRRGNPEGPVEIGEQIRAALGIKGE